jgi:MoaA/NifB/PqqE/SkfB family radical SAM enzyme
MNNAPVQDQNNQITTLSKLMLWPSSGCNAKCKSCDIWQEKAGVSLSYEQIKEWVPQWKALSLKTVVICGEPLMYADLWKVIDEIQAHNIRVELLTNGLLLERNAQNVVNHVKVVRVSLDGPEDHHNVSRGRSSAFAKLEAGVKAVRALDPNFDIAGRCHIHAHNFKHLVETVRAAQRLSLSGISFSATDSSNQEAFRREATVDANYTEQFAIRGNALQELEQELQKLYSVCEPEFNSGFISDSPEKLNNIILGYYKELDGGPKRALRCNSPWSSAVVEYNGVLRPCFPMAAFANAKDYPSFSEALNSPEAMKIREILNVEGNPICRACVDQSWNL